MSTAFEAARETAPADVGEAFARVGRFRLNYFRLGEGAAAAEIEYFPDGTEMFDPLREFESMPMTWGLDQLRVFVNDMAEGPERAYLSGVAKALSAYNWLQWAVEDTGKAMLPDSSLQETGRRTRELMDELEPLRNPDAPQWSFAAILAARPGFTPG